MTKIINCDDGYVARGRTDDELVADAERHMQEAHPELVGKVTRDQLLSQAIEV